MRGGWLRIEGFRVKVTREGRIMLGGTTRDLGRVGRVGKGRWSATASAEGRAFHVAADTRDQALQAFVAGWLDTDPRQSIGKVGPPIMVRAAEIVAERRAAGGVLCGHCGNQCKTYDAASDRGDCCALPPEDVNAQPADPAIHYNDDFLVLVPPGALAYGRGTHGWEAHVFARESDARERAGKLKSKRALVVSGRLAGAAPALVAALETIRDGVGIHRAHDAREVAADALKLYRARA